MSTTNPPIKIARMPASQAFTWLKNAFLLIKAKPWILCITVAWMFLPFLLLLKVPVVGPIIIAAIFPALSFGMAHINQKVRLQEPVTPLDIFSGFHPSHRTRLLAIGACLAILLFILASIMQQFDLSVLHTFSEKIRAQSGTMDLIALGKEFETVMQDPKFMRASTIINLFTLANIAIVGLFCYAPLFTAWQNTDPLKSIGLSILTILRNIIPLTIISMITGFLGLIAIYLSLLFVALNPTIGIWFALMSMFLYLAYLFSVIFCSFHNIVTSSIKKSLTSNS